MREQSEFVHLHVHSEYSILIPPGRLVTANPFALLEEKLDALTSEVALLRDALASVETDGWLSTGAAARHLGLSEAAVRARVARGTLAAYVFEGGTTLRFRRVDLDAALLPVRPGDSA